MSSPSKDNPVHIPPQDTVRRFRERLRSMLIEKGLSMYDVEDAIGVYRCTGQKWLSPSCRFYPRISTMMRLCWFLNVNPEWLGGFTNVRRDWAGKSAEDDLALQSVDEFLEKGDK